MSSERIFNFTNIFRELQDYMDVKEELKNIILTNFKSRNTPCKVILNNDVLDATYGRVLINLLIMKPFRRKRIKLV